jgi:DivIVA domain-containing protein
MTDDAFHLTALDVRRYDFGNALRGYDRSRVDQFRDQVAEELERLTRSNQELDQKARNFHEQLKSFRERDKALNDALVSAQQLRGEIREQAEREAQLIIREARAEAEKGLAKIREDVRRAEDELQKLWRARRGYLSQLRNQLERELQELITAENEPPPPGVPSRESQTRESPARSAAAGQPAPPETQPMLEELRELKPRGMAPTPSWLDALDEK